MLKDLCVALDINQQVNDPEIIKFNSNPDPDSTQTAFVCPDSEVGQIKINKSLEVPDWREISTGKTGWMEFRASHRLCSPTNLATATLLAPQIASQRRLRRTAVLAKGGPRPLS